MKDESSSNSSANPSPPEPSPAGSQNLIIGLILGAMALLLLHLIFPKISSNNTGGGTSEVDKLRKELDARRKALS